MPKDQLTFTYRVSELLNILQNTISYERSALADMQTQLSGLSQPAEPDDKKFQSYHQQKRDLDAALKRAGKRLVELDRWERSLQREPGERKLKLHYDDLEYFGA